MSSPETPDNSAEPKPKPSVEELEADLAEQRRHLGETVDALSQKLDVKSRARERVDEVRQQAVERATDADGRPSVAVSAAAGVAAAALVGAVVLWWGRRGQ